MPRPRAVLLRVGVLGTAAGLLLSGCSLPWSGPDVSAAARRLAAGLEKGSLAAVPVAGGARAADTSYDDLAGGLRASGTKPSISVGPTRTDGDRASAELDWAWRLGASTWRYQTTARFTRTGQQWRLVWSPAVVHDGLRGDDRLVRSTLAARRGDVLGAGGRALVTARPVLTVGLDKSRTPRAQVTRSATRLARLLGIDAGAFSKLVAASGAQAFVPGITYRRDEVPAAVTRGLTSIPGAGSLAGTRPLAPTKGFAAGLLGTVGPATAEIVQKSDGRVQPGDVVGLSGLQERYDEQLAGRDGARVSAVGPGGSHTRVLFSTTPVAGQPLRLTLDRRLQSLAEQALSSVGPASALVAVQPSTGDLLAAASGPGSKGYDTATLGRYAPGSTFKIVSSLALLRAGETPSTRVPCTPTTVVDGKRFKNYSDYPSSALGTITLQTALANSCNTAFVSQRGRLGSTSLAGAAAALGLGVDRETGFPSYFGQVGRPSSETQAAASMIGQGTVLASPMAMATVVASVVHGSTVVPRLVEGADVDARPPSDPLTSAEAAALRTMMRAVVTQGSGARLAGLPGGPVIAKTGTAEFGQRPPLPTHAWMVAGQGDLAVAVFVDRGESGSQTAGPILEQFLRGAAR